MRTAQEAVYSDIETSRSVYGLINHVCVQSLVRPASAAHALNNGVPNIERADKLVQLIARQKGLSHPVIDEIAARVDARLDANRRKAA